VQGEEQPDAVRAAVAVDEQVGGLADPVVDRRAGELDPRGSVVEGQEGGGRVTVADESSGQLQMSSWAVRSFGAGLLAVVGVAVAPVTPVTPVTVTVFAPA
jgi:hypothetical protein